MSAPGGTSAQPGGRHPLVEMFVIAAPSVVTMASYTIMQFVDGMMVSQIRPPDPVYVAAQGNGGMAAWLALSVAMGMLGVVSTFVSQHFGAGRPERGSAYGWSVLWMALVWAVVLIPYGLLMPVLFRWMDHPAELVAMETEYAQINIMGAFFVLASRGIAHFFFGIHRPAIVMTAVIVANLVNVALNAVLIYGTAGPPAGTPLAGVFASIAETLGVAPMGVAGAAWGTVVGSTIELGILMAVFLSPKMQRLYRTRDVWRPSVAHVRDILRLGWPAGVMFLNEMLCWAFLMTYMLAAGGAAKARLLELPPDQFDAAVESAKTTANTAGWIALRYMHLSFMPAAGMSIAVATIVGKCIGMNRPDLAEKRAWLGAWLTVGYMGACALAFVTFREDLIDVFVPESLKTTDPQAAADLLRVGSLMIITAAVFQVFDALVFTMSAALRGAGDTLWPGVVTVVASWTCVVGIGYGLLRLAPQLGSIGPWIGASVYIIVLGIVMTVRFMRGRWKTLDVLGKSADGRRPDPGTPTEALAAGMPGEA